MERQFKDEKENSALVEAVINVMSDESGVTAKNHFGRPYVDFLNDGYDCCRNALDERINDILKGEFLLNRPSDMKQASKMVAQSVRIYNKERPHTAMQYKTPDAVGQACMHGNKYCQPILGLDR